MATRQIFNFRYKSPSHWIEVFKTYYGPTHRAFAALETAKQVHWKPISSICSSG